MTALHGATLLVVLALVACTGGATGPTATPASTPSATRTPVAATATATPTASPTRSPAPSPTSTLTPAVCPMARGGSAGASRPLAAVRIAHQPGFDRIVFDFGPGALPEYVVEQAREFIGISGQPVAVQGNAFLSVRFPRAGESGSYAGPRTFTRPTALIREMKVVEDFEAQLIWGIGLERQECPRILVLSSPARLVLDLPTPP